jgi:hypothetical protein
MIPQEAIKDHNFTKVKQLTDGSVYQCSNCKIKLFHFEDLKEKFYLPYGDLTNIINECKFYYYYPDKPMWILVKDLFYLTCVEIRIKDILL